MTCAEKRGHKYLNCNNNNSFVPSKTAEIKQRWMTYDGTYLAMTCRALWHWSKFLERSDKKMIERLFFSFFFFFNKELISRRLWSDKNRSAQQLIDSTYSHWIWNLYLLSSSSSESEILTPSTQTITLTEKNKHTVWLHKKVRSQKRNMKSN